MRRRPSRSGSTDPDVQTLDPLDPLPPAVVDGTGTVGPVVVDGPGTVGPVVVDGTGTVEEDRALKQGGVALVANGAATGLLGLAYWVVAAHLFGAVALGRNSALISALLTISGLAQLNYTRSLSSLIPRAGAGARRLVRRVYVIVGLLSLALGAVFVFVGPSISSRFSYLRPAEVLVPVFAVSVVLWSVYTLEDGVLASLRRAPMITIKNSAYGVLKLIVIVILYKEKFGRFSIFAATIIPLVIVVLPVDVYIFRRAIPAMLGRRPAATEDLPETALDIEAPAVGVRWVRLDFIGYMLWLLGTSPLPILVLAVLGPRASAQFYLGLTVAMAVDLLTLNIGNTVTAEVSRNGGVVTRHATRHMLRIWAFVLFGSAVLAIFAPQIFQLFGRHYGHTAGLILRLLLLAAPARSAMFFANAVARGRGSGGSILLRQSVAAVGTVVLGLVLMPHIGVTGMAYAWLIASTAGGLLGVVWLVPYLRRKHRTPPPGLLRPAGSTAGAAT